MADTAAQKREARRRRILENSENRLKRITGLYSNAGSSDPNNDVIEESVSYHEAPSILSVTSDISAVKESLVDVTNNVESFMETPTAPENVPITDESLWKHTSSGDKSPLVSPGFSTLQTRSSVLNILCWKARLHIIVLAVIVRILLTLPCRVLLGESAIVPLCTMEFAEWLNTNLHSTTPQNTSSGLLGMALMLSGIAPQKVSHLLGVLDIFNRLTQDFFIYFFVFCMTHAFLEILK